MIMEKMCVVASAVLLAALVWSAGAAAADKHSGTWKMDPAKSKYSPGPTPKNVNLTIEADESGIKINAEGTDGNGNPTLVAYDAKFDGKDYPVTGVSGADTVSVKRVGADTIQATMKKGDNVVMTVTSKVSADGKTRTSTFHGKDAQGQTVHNVVVYDKQ
jgi:ABC-type sugar transport system substrate-binding protein